MDIENYTTITEFHLLGFHVNKKLQLLLFFLFFIIYLSTVTGNIIIITVISQCSKLHHPMYLFLCNFAFMEIGYISVIMPKMLSDFVSDKKIISVTGCVTQFYFFFVLGGIENYLLAVMSYDRCLAICNPLRYTAIMNIRFCHQLALLSWLASFTSSLGSIYFLSKLSFCGDNEVNHFFCDASPLLQLSCTDTSLLQTYLFSLIWLVVFSCLIFIVVSYFQIILVILRIPSKSGQKKVFSTCGSHFTVVVLYYGSVISMYVRANSGNTFEYDKIISVFYAIITPFLNPIIYSLRNRAIREALQSYKCKIISALGNGKQFKDNK